MERINFEDMWERAQRRNPEVVKLEAAIERIVLLPVGDPPLPPTTGIRLCQLEMLLQAELQRDGDGTLRYLVTSGLAVEMLTGFSREHHDIDLVIMDPFDRKRWDIIGTDNVTPGKYWADMIFEAQFLQETARSVKTRKRRESPVAEVVHPAIIMVQKSSDAFGRPPRSKDMADVSALVRHWVEKEAYTRKWNPIIRHALNALPSDQVQTTLDRLKAAVSEG